jgi:N-methylhydantoinase A
MQYRMGIDIGGTFTDFALFNDDTGAVYTHKQLTSPRDPAQAVIEGTSTLCKMAGVTPADLSSVVHGTTLVTNAIIERRGVPTAMLVTEGFADVLDIALERRYDLFDLRITYPVPVVPRRRRIEVAERVAYDGRAVKPLNLEGLEATVRRLVGEEAIEAVAVCFLHSYSAPAHENEVCDWLRSRFPALAISGSADVFPFIREYQRWTTACLNAYVQPVVSRYVDHLEHGLERIGFAGSFYVMSSSGGTLTADTARRYPIRMLESGPAAGALMAARHGNKLALPQILSFDMGGTTAKGCIVKDSQPLKRYEMEVARVHEFKKGSGLPVKIPVLDMIEIGAGGGSLAEVDERGTLRVGPKSASADPGPACYGRGGKHPTLTDANLVLGYLDPESFLGGNMALDREAARAAISNHIARPLGISIEQAAFGIHEVISEDVARAFRVHASERGVDYRRCSMVAFGGSGPLHAARIARKLRIPRLICPWGAGVMSAFGLLTSPIGFELVKSSRISLSELTAAMLMSQIDQLGQEASRFLIAAGLSKNDVKLKFRLDMRYEGQGYEVEVPIDQNIPGQELLERLPILFAAEYSNVFGKAFPHYPIEIISWKADAQGPALGSATNYTLRGKDSLATARKGSRAVFMPQEAEFRTCPVYDRYALVTGDRIDGPALIEEHESTCVLGTEDVGTVDALGNVIVDLVPTT